MGKLSKQIFIIETKTDCLNAEDWIEYVKDTAISNCLCGLEDLFYDEFCSEEEQEILDRIYKCMNEYRKGIE